MFYRRVLRENHQILTFKQYVKEYLEKCTITGLKHFAAPRLHPLEFNWVRYDTNPIVQSVEKNYREWEFETPAVTLCYLDKVDEEKAKIYIKRYCKLLYLVSTISTHGCL
ncbi:hypothetical protein C0J52_21044 [Blattella germanica]|nr:hypothetical protein C0J52_21044 [Blattella germanica]